MSHNLSTASDLSISYRQAATEHISLILEMMEAFYAIDHYPFDRALNEQNLHEFLNTEHLGRLWLIQDGASVIGYLVLAYGYSFEYKGRDAFLDEFFLREAYRSRGIGKLTIDFLIEQAALLGVKVIHLEAERHNEKALRLYEGKGFATKGRFLLTKYL